MAIDLQFAFLGYQHNYLASVTQVGMNGRPTKGSVTESYGLPDHFTKRYKEFASKRYIYNIRGHDFLSHMGHWTSEATAGPVLATPNSFGEIEVLKVFARDNESNGFKETDLIISFGGGSGSFFADAFRLKRYRWNKLPIDLEDEIQKEVCRNGYGKIYDVAMNAVGGWVMQLSKGARFRWGGQLPDDLKQALERGLQRKATISRLFLNHQHPTEYVLLFSDGQTYIRLHNSFQDPFKALIEKWAASKKVKNFAWNFKPSCCCSEAEQRQMNAIYYNRRGLFHLSRGNPEQALSYLREAFKLHESNADIRRHYAIALAAVRQYKHDSILEEYLVRRRRGSDGPRRNPIFLNDNRDGSSEFRIEYLTWMLDIMGDDEGLEKELNEFTILGRQENGGITQEETTREWSYSMAIGQEPTAPPDRPIELCSREVIELPGSPFIEGSDVQGAHNIFDAAKLPPGETPPDTITTTTPEISSRAMVLELCMEFL